MNYPTSLDTAATLHDIRNNLNTTLSAAYTSPATTLSVADNSGFPTTGSIIYVGGERCTYTGVGTGTLTGVSGLGNNYAAGTVVEQLVDAQHHNDLRLAVVALETKVGINASADTASIDYKLGQKPDLSGSNPVALGAAAPGAASTAARQDHVHPTTGLELTANKATGFGTVNDTLYPTVQAVKTYADSLVVGLLDDRGSYNASGNAWPSSGGSGAAGAILKGDLWYISVAGTLGGTPVSVGDTIRALVDSPGTVAGNWDIIIAPVSVAGQINGAASKTTPADADKLGMTDSAAGGALVYLSWANLKAALRNTALTWTAIQTFTNSMIKLLGSSTGATTLTSANASATNYTLTLPAATDTLVGQATTDTLTNKRVTLRVGSTTSSATPSINTDAVDVYKLTAQTVDITSMTTNLTGTPTDNQPLIIEITGTAARAITWGASFEASTVALPTTTVGTAMLAVAFLYNSATSKWRCVGAV